MAILGISLGTGRKSRGPGKTAEQAAAEKRTQIQLDKEIEEEESRLKAAARGQLGTSSLLGGQSKRRTSSAGGSRTGRTGGAGSLGGATGGTTSGGGSTGSSRR